MRLRRGGWRLIIKAAFSGLLVKWASTVLQQTPGLDTTSAAHSHNTPHSQTVPHSLGSCECSSNVYSYEAHAMTFTTKACGLSQVLYTLRCLRYTNRPSHRSPPFLYRAMPRHVQSRKLCCLSCQSIKWRLLYLLILLTAPIVSRWDLEKQPGSEITSSARLPLAARIIIRQPA